MAKHMKRMPLPYTWRAAAIVASSVVGLALICAVVIYSGLLNRIAGVFAHKTETVHSSVTTVPTTVSEEPVEIVRHFSRPEEIKGVWLNPGVDYLKDDKYNAEDVKKQLDSLLESAVSKNFNTLFLPMSKEGKALFFSSVLESVILSQEDGTVFDPLSYLLSKAREKKLYVYGIINLMVSNRQLYDPRTEDGQNKLVTFASECASTYAFDGFFVADFAYPIKSLDTEQKSKAIASLNELMPRIIEAVRKAGNDYYIGLVSNGIWSHKSVNSLGSDTGEYYEEFTDGCADTLSWVSHKLFDCVLVQDYASTAHPTASFQKVLDWWGEIAEKYEIPLYISHSAKRIGSFLAGWRATDQLAQQYLYCKANTAWKGSAFDSLTPLINDKTGMAETLDKAYAGTLNEEFIYKSLTVTSPSNLTYTTKESTVVFQGGGDTNFPLTVNGATVDLTEHGFFSCSFTLSVGVNTFVFSHKGATKTYKITYQQELIESVSPAEKMSVDGGNTFIITANGRIGSSLVATVGNQQIKLTAEDTKKDETADIPSDYQTYRGSMVLPAGIIGKEQNLGVIKVTAKYNGMTETKSGGAITVNALPTPTTTAATQKPTTTSGGTSSTTGPKPDQPGDTQVVVVKSDYAETFDGGSCVDDYSRPYNSYLPQNTRDILDKTVYNGSFSYYLLRSGKRIYIKDANLITIAMPQAQALRDGSISVSGNHTVFTYATDWNIPVYISAYPQKYYSSTNFTIYSQTATYVDVVFHYITSVPSLPSFSDNPLFKSGEWIKGSSDVWTMRLYLKKAGGFYGYTTYWTATGSLKVSFLNPADVSQNTDSEKLKGIKILVDPGHGTATDKPWEGPINLQYALTLRDKLEALGATVVMTRTTELSSNLSLQTRASMAHGKDYDLLISVHMNGANGKATGATAWYYSEYGYTASHYIYEKMHQAETPYGVGTTANGTPRASGTNWSTLYMNRAVFDCPSVLLECAFLDNPKDKEALINPVYRDKLMQATVDGVVAYFSSR